MGPTNPASTGSPDPVPANPLPGLPPPSQSPATPPALAKVSAGPAPSTAGDVTGNADQPAASLPSLVPPTVAPVAPKSPAMSTLAALAETLSQLQAQGAPDKQVHAVINSIAVLVAQSSSPVPGPLPPAPLHGPPPPRGPPGPATPPAAPAIPSSPARTCCKH